VKVVAAALDIVVVPGSAPGTAGGGWHRVAASTVGGVVVAEDRAVLHCPASPAVGHAATAEGVLFHPGARIERHSAALVDRHSAA
jgi:hypothetical protein